MFIQKIQDQTFAQQKNLNETYLRTPSKIHKY